MPKLGNSNEFQISKVVMRPSVLHLVIDSYTFHIHTGGNARSVTAFNSTDIRAEHDNVATPVTAMMATVCISTDIRPATELMW